MNAKNLLKPTPLKIAIFLFLAVFFLYFAKEDVCAVSLFFAVCYNAYGFPLSNLITGNIDGAAQIQTLFLDKYFAKIDNFLFNPLTFLLDLIFIYLLACSLSMLFNKIKIKT